MGLFKRIGDIISANLNDMVEGFEDPEKMLKQAIREMELAIADAKQEVVQAMASEKMVGKSIADHERQIFEWQQRAEKAVQSSDDALARKALQRKQENQKVLAALRDQESAAVETSQTLRRQYEAMKAKLAEAKRKVETLAARKKAADVRSRMVEDGAHPVLDTAAFEKFERLREKVERAEAEADARRELETGSASSVRSAREPDGLDMGSEVSELDAELAALRRKVRG